ncbi:flagellar export protein FliJ [Allorhodopirellula solitaria]|uniref:Flagellar FliJ protein n=1 Tax=Allorhodopirellula solitaria TaxID=2527987 RepID=A0A5C5XU72_9BACT|nr:flagellar export protein FliJ [Allorhodopirellula solitaria]TWT66109.1 flagellar biosynthesis chaperone [Allorhodopirellula solitaria]
MPPFHFRFDSLLTLHRRRRDEVSRELGKIRAAIDQFNDQIDRLQQQRDTLRQETAHHLAGSVDSAPPVRLDRLQHEARYDGQLAQEQDSLRSNRKQLDVELEQQRRCLVEAEAEVKRFERLREKQAATHQQREQKREQAAMDELAQARMIYSRR